MMHSSNSSLGTLPPRLRRHDKIAVCAPASPVDPQRLRQGVQVLEKRYRVQMSEGVFARKGYLAGDDERRTEEFNQLLRDPDIRAIIPAGGGYGITRILSDLDASALRKDPKIIIGFSDATALLCWGLAVAGVRGVHGPMVSSLGERSSDQQEHMLDLLEGHLPGPIPCSQSTSLSHSNGDSLEGPLLGGNLTLLCAMIGTPYQLDLKGALLFLEDIEKLPSAVDRMLTHLHTAGLLKGVKVALLGALYNCLGGADEAEIIAEEAAAERLKAFGIPLFPGVPLGHGTENLALPFGGQARVDFKKRELIIEERAVI